MRGRRRQGKGVRTEEARKGCEDGGLHETWIMKVSSHVNNRCGRWAEAHNTSTKDPFMFPLGGGGGGNALH